MIRTVVIVNGVVKGIEAADPRITAFKDSLSWRKDRSPLLFNLSSNPKYSYYGAMQDYKNSGY